MVKADKKRLRLFLCILFHEIEVNHVEESVIKEALKYTYDDVNRVLEREVRTGNIKKVGDFYSLTKKGMESLKLLFNKYPVI